MNVLLSPFVSGFLVGASLIIAIGAQNAFILRQGLLRQHVFVLCFICALSDAVLIAAGVMGLGALITRFPWLISIITLAGAAFLLVYGLMATRRALNPVAMKPGDDAGLSLRAAIMTCLAFTFLNPHVYLDTFILIGGIASGYQGALRLAFAAGAMIASFVWFFGLGYGARLLTPVFSQQRSWRILDCLIAIVMFGLAASLLLRFFQTTAI